LEHRKEEEQQNAGENYVIRCFMLCTLQHVIFIATKIKGGTLHSREARNAYEMFVLSPEGERLLFRLGLIWRDGMD
jgi:hypothetical protein